MRWLISALSIGQKFYFLRRKKNSFFGGKLGHKIKRLQSRKIRKAFFNRTSAYLCWYWLALIKWSDMILSSFFFTLQFLVSHNCIDYSYLKKWSFSLSKCYVWINDSCLSLLIRHCVRSKIRPVSCDSYNSSILKCELGGFILVISSLQF